MMLLMDRRGSASLAAGALAIIVALTGCGGDSDTAARAQKQVKGTPDEQRVIASIKFLIDNDTNDRELLSDPKDWELVGGVPTAETVTPTALAFAKEFCAAAAHNNSQAVNAVLTNWKSEHIDSDQILGAEQSKSALTTRHDFWLNVAYYAAFPRTTLSGEPSPSCGLDRAHNDVVRGWMKDWESRAIPND